jgi:DNA invertase Pin-like site-specific DNA recombinase
MKVGYIRVSTKEQNTARQEVLMKELNVDKVYIEKISGKDKNRPQLNEMLSFVRDGDTIIVESYSRLARSTKDLLEIVDQLASKNVGFVSQKEAVDTSTPTGRLFLTVMAGINQFEREVTLQRQAEGVAIAKAEGKYKGRKPIEVDDEMFTELYKQWKEGDTQPKYMMKKLGLSNRSTFYRKVKLYEDKHGIK